MVSVVTSASAGLVNSSRDVLGAAGEVGNSATGRAGERVTVNAATGNLVLQDRDEFLAGAGPDVDLLRTYNSVGGWDGDNGDGWRLGYYRRVSGLIGLVNTTNSSIQRIEADGSESVYSYNGTRYVCTDGAGQYDSLSFDGSSWTWTDGDSGIRELYEASGAGNYRLRQITDADGNYVRVDYAASGLISTLGTYKAGATVASETLTLTYALGQSTSSSYDKDNRLLTQSFIGKIDNLSDTSGNYTLTYTYYTSTADSASSDTGTGALASSVQQPTSGAATTTTYQYKYWDSEQQSKITKAAAGMESHTSLGYDINGHISSTLDDGTGVNRSYVTNANGQVLRRSGANGTHYFYYADGHRIGDVGNTPDDKSRVSYAEELARRGSVETAAQRRERYKKPSPVTSADFDQNYEPINDNFPGNAASSYTVSRNGETLRDIAQAMWGDSSLWYLIAESNGMLTDGALVAGRVIVIPNKVANIHNNSTTWRPYSAGEAIGAVDPTLFNQSVYKQMIESMDWREAHPVQPLVHPHGPWISGNRSFVESYDSGERSSLVGVSRDSSSAASVGYYNFDPLSDSRYALGGANFGNSVGQGAPRLGDSGNGNKTTPSLASINVLLTSNYSYASSLAPQLASLSSGARLGSATIDSLGWSAVAQRVFGGAIEDSIASRPQSSPGSAYGYRSGTDVDSDPAYEASRNEEWADQNDDVIFSRGMDILRAGSVKQADGSILRPNGKRVSVAVSDVVPLTDIIGDASSFADRRRSVYLGKTGPVEATGARQQTYGFIRNTPYLVPGVPAWAQPADGSALRYSFDSAGQVFWRVGDSQLIATPAPYALPAISSLQGGALWSGVTDAIYDLPNLPSHLAEGVGNLLTGNFTVSGLLQGFLESSPVGWVINASNEDYTAVGRGSVGFGVGLVGGLAVEKAVVPSLSRGVSGLTGYASDIWDAAADVRGNPFMSEQSFSTGSSVGDIADAVNSIQTRLQKLISEGHGVQRHGAQVTGMQLEGRAVEGLDPMTGTTVDGVHGGTHQYAQHATQVVSDEAYVFAENYGRNSQQFIDKITASTTGRAQLEIPLKEIYGDEFREFVSGVTRYGPKAAPTGFGNTVFSDGAYMIIRYKQNSIGSWKFNTMFPQPE